MFNKWLGKVFDGPCHPKGKLGSGVITKLSLPTAERVGQLVVHPLLAETCIQRKTMYLSAALIGNEFRVHLTLLRKHFTVRVFEFMLIPPWMIANAMLKSKTSESELIKKKQCLTWMTISLRAHYEWYWNQESCFSSHTPTPESCFWHCGSCGNCLITLRTRSFSRACSDWFSTYIYTGEYCPSFYVNCLKAQYCRKTSIHPSIHLTDTFYTIHPIRRQIS